MPHTSNLTPVTAYDSFFRINFTIAKHIDMKKSSIIFKSIISLSILVLVSLSQATYAQNTEKQEKENAKIEALKQMVEARQFVFMAESATPMSGRTRQLTYDYKLRIKKDTIDSDLPFYGRAYSSTYGDTDGGINFKTSDFEYSSKEGAKGGWNIIIAPKEIKNVDRMLLNITNAGYATLQVTSNTRQTISFNGYIMELK